MLVALPAQHLREHLTGLAWPASIAAVICAKGIERDSLKSMPEVMAEIQPALSLAMLSGPTFAGEVARGLPAAVVIAGRDNALVEGLTAALATPEFRPYASDDPVGVALGGAVKNVLAIGCGIVVGRGLGENARAALLTRGLAELARLVAACGGRRETAMGLSGAGDLILTATSAQSRNTSLGVASDRAWPRAWRVRRPWWPLRIATTWTCPSARRSPRSWPGATSIRNYAACWPGR